MGDDRGDRAIEPEQQVVSPALDRAEDLVEVPAGPPDPNRFDLVKIHGLLARPYLRPRLRPQVHPQNPGVSLRYLSGALQLPSLSTIGSPDARTAGSPFSPRRRPRQSELKSCGRGGLPVCSPFPPRQVSPPRTRPQPGRPKAYRSHRPRLPPGPSTRRSSGHPRRRRPRP